MLTHHLSSYAFHGLYSNILLLNDTNLFFQNVTKAARKGLNYGLNHEVPQNRTQCTHLSLRIESGDVSGFPVKMSNALVQTFSTKHVL